MINPWLKTMVAVALIPFLGCRTDAPLAPTASRVLAPPSFGVAPNPGLLTVSSLTYSAGAGSFLVGIVVKKGLGNAAGKNGLNIGIDLTLRITNAAGQVRAVAPDCFPLADQKVLGVSPDPYLMFGLAVPWDQRDEAGKPMTGKAQVGYVARLIFRPGGVEKPLGPVAGGAVTLELPAVQ